MHTVSPLSYCRLVAPVVRITWWYFGDRLSNINARITCLKSHFESWESGPSQAPTE